MYKLCVFGGTTEGRELVEFLNTQPCRVTACVATEYGQTLLRVDHQEHRGRLRSGRSRALAAAARRV